MLEARDPFKVRNVGRWQQLPNECDGALISNEALIREFVTGSEIGQATREKYAQLLYEFAERQSETRDVSLLHTRRPDVIRFLTYLKTDERAARDDQRSQRCGWKGALAPSSRKGYLAAIRELWRYCATMEYVEHDTCLELQQIEVICLSRIAFRLEELLRLAVAPDANGNVDVAGVEAFLDAKRRGLIDDQVELVRAEPEPRAGK